LVVESGELYGPMVQCNDCGDYAEHELLIKHYSSCSPGEAEYWENYYNQDLSEDYREE
ncbi:hypothetical protein LCGC14_1733400, partial [marine sediment metagenome]